MLNLAVTIDQESGFCFGVVYAIEMAEEILAEKGYLYCLGDIVHNDEEVDRLKAKGLKIISQEDLINLQNETVLIRAHGEPPATYQTALANNITLIDASCPVVLKLQNRVKNSFDDEEQIYIYGKHGHAEVIALRAAETIDCMTARWAHLPNHVLEHVDDELKAMKELCRILKPGGLAIMQVPQNPDLKKTISDPTITDPEERHRLFGQYDHVRLFGQDYPDILKKAGFKVEEVDYSKKLTKEEFDKFALPKRELLYVCTK